jgi:hypothetical protein
MTAGITRATAIRAVHNRTTRVVIDISLAQHGAAGDGRYSTPVEAGPLLFTYLLDVSALRIRPEHLARLKAERPPGGDHAG